MLTRLLRLLLLAVPLFGLLISPIKAQITRYVSTTGTNANPATATSWATSTTNLQGAINASSPNDQVWVARGVYKPTTDPTDKSASFVLKTGVAVYGGFLGDESSFGLRPAVNPISGQPSIGTPTGTTLSGDIDNNGMLSGNSYHVVSNTAGQNATALLDGFVIAGGNADFPSDLYGPTNKGGGMHNNNSSPTVANCVFQSNSATREGGGLYNANSSPTVTNCVFQSNSATHNGGGIANEVESNPTLTRCLIVGNMAQSGGGGTNASGSPTLTSCSIVSNTATGTAGGMAIYGSKVIMNNCLIANNVTPGDGGGVQTNNSNGLTAMNYPTLTSCTLVGNSAHTGGGIANGSRVEITLTDCFISNNTATTGGGGGMYAIQSKPNLTNCIIQANTASSAGGGLYYESDRSSLLTNCTFESNTSKQGGGMYNSYGSSPTLAGCTFLRNSGEDGGGMYNNATTSPTLTNCVFQSNSATTRGGGIHNDGAEFSSIVLNLKNCNFLDNWAMSVGGGISSLTSTVGLTNCKFHRNSSFSGGAIAAFGDISTLIQCSLLGNTATNGGAILADNATIQATNCSFQGNVGAIGGAILANFAQATQLTNCVLFGNGGNNTLAGGASIVATYSLFENTVTNYTGTNNLTTAANPFASSTDTPLAPGSPAVDVGLNSAPGLAGISTDLAGNPRFVGLNCRVDMGAYEFQQPNSFGNLILVAGNGTLSCASPTVSLTAIGGNVYSFSGPGVISQFSGSGARHCGRVSHYSYSATRHRHGGGESAGRLYGSDCG